MSTNQQILADPSAERMARVSALYEFERRSSVAAGPASADSSHGVIEAPCRLAPTVLRRFPRRRPAQSPTE